MPILKRFYPDRNEQDLAELAEVAVVNSPELTKGEETGFEFVHKSFAEFLVGERFAGLVERVAFKAPEYGSDDVTWRMSEQDAARELAPMFGIRLMPDEVQEMLEPMLGCFAPFSKGERVDEVVAAPARKDGLTRIVERFESVFADFLRGGSLEIVAKLVSGSSRLRSPLEAYANYCAGILIIGTAASRQLRQFNGKSKQHRFFSGEPFKGAFWRSLCILAAGGISLDDVLADRLLDGMQVTPTADSPPPNDLESPLRLGFLNRAEGYKTTIGDHLARCLRYTFGLEQMLFAFQFIVQALGRTRLAHEREPSLPFNLREVHMYALHREATPIGAMAHELAESGMVPAYLLKEVEKYKLDYLRLMERLVSEMRETGRIDKVLQYFMRELHSEDAGPIGRDLRHLLVNVDDLLGHDWHLRRG